MPIFDRGLPHLILRIGVAFALLYPPYAALMDPQSWLGYFPGFVHSWNINELLLLHSFGALEVILALWILSGWRILIPSAATTVLLLAIVVMNGNQFEVLFRDLAIAAATLALAIDARRKPVPVT